MPGYQRTVPPREVSRRELSILLIEHNLSDALLVERYLSQAPSPFKMHHVSTLDRGIEFLRQTAVDAVVLDLNLPDSHGLETFRTLREEAAAVPTVILSDEGDDELALAAVRAGAEEYLVKDQAISTSLGRSIRYAVERFHRQRVEGDVDRAAFIQQRLFPKAPPRVRGVDLAGRCAPAEQMGGDYFDYFLVDDGSLLLAIGDVADHGFGPSLVMAETRAALRTLTKATEDVGAVMEQLNQLLVGDDLGLFVTLFIARVHVPSRRCRYAAAGQPVELMRSRGVSERLGPLDPPIGVVHRSFGSAEIELGEGDILLLYTDGITERKGRAGQLFGVSRALDAIRSCQSRPAEEIVDRLFHAANDFAGGDPQHDDMTAIVLKICG